MIGREEREVGSHYRSAESIVVPCRFFKEISNRRKKGDERRDDAAIPSGTSRVSMIKDLYLRSARIRSGFLCPRVGYVYNRR